jgi:ubiquitin-protein ligase
VCKQPCGLSSSSSGVAKFCLMRALQSPANAEAARLFTADRREYNRRVKRVAARSIEDAWS